MPPAGSQLCTAGTRFVAPSPPDWLIVERLHPTTGRLLAPATDAENTAFSRFLHSQRSGRDAWRHAPFASWMLAIVRTHAEWLLMSAVRPLRAFAHACAFGEGRLIAAVGNWPTTSFDVEGAARCDPAALARLAAFHATDADPVDAAFWSAAFAARRSAFLALSGPAAKWACADRHHRDVDPAWHLAHFAHHHPETLHATLLRARTRQAQLFRTVLPDPFGEPTSETRVQVFFETGPDANQRV